MRTFECTQIYITMLHDDSDVTFFRVFTFLLHTYSRHPTIHCFPQVFGKLDRR